VGVGGSGWGRGREGGDVLVLDNFVAGLSGASALDEGVAAAEDGDGVFADVAEPDVCQGAGAFLHQYHSHRVAR